MSASLLREAATAIRRDAAALIEGRPWHPAVALAVADWLDVAARDLWAHGTDCYEADHEPCWECDDDLAAPHVRAAVTVARAYLGGDDE